MNVNFVAIALCASLVSFVPAHAEDVGTGGDLRQAIEQSNREDLRSGLPLLARTSTPSTRAARVR